MLCDLAAAVMSLISYRSAFDKLPETAHLSWVRLCSVFFENSGTLQPSGNDVYPLLFSVFRNLMVKGWSNRSRGQWGFRGESDLRRCGGFSCSHSAGLVDKTRWGLLPLDNETSLSWTDLSYFPVQDFLLSALALSQKVWLQIQELQIWHLYFITLCTRHLCNNKASSPVGTSNFPN